MKNKSFKDQHRWKWKIWVYILSLIMIAAAGGLSSSSKADIVNGTQIGTLNGRPVVKAQSNDMGSVSFQGTVNGLLKSANTAGVKYVGDNIGWQSNTSLYKGQALSNFGSAARAFLGNDGFLPGDLAIHLNKGEFFIVQNVGTIKDIKTGQRIPVSMAVTNNGLAHGSDGQTNENAIYAVKNQGGTITIGAVTPVSGTDTGGGQSENGGGSGGDVGDGSLVGFINKIRTRVSLVRSDTGQAIPDDDILIAMKVSDVDANQLAEVGGNGAIGYIVSPNSALTVAGNGLRSTSDGATVTDSALLMDNSYVILQRYNSSLVDYTYMDGKGDHADIVWALFGEIHFELNLEGTFQLDKSLLDYGDTLPNNHYAFTPIVFDIFDKDNKDVGDITVPANGKAVESPSLPAGDYTVKERASSVTLATGQTANTQSYKVTVVAGKTGSAGTTVKVNNQAVLGKITISKSLEGYGKTLPNNLYGFAGIQYKVTSKDGKYTDVVTLDKDGNGTSKNLPLGEYDVQEIANSVVASTGQIYNPTVYHVTLTWKDNATALVTSSVATENKPVLVKISVDKSGEESLKDMYNGHYSLKGNQFKLTSKTDGKSYTITTDEKGLASIDKLPLGEYYVEEIVASDGFVITFIPQTLKLVWKDNQTAVITGEVKGTNKEIKGQNQLDKTDKETNAADSRGKGDLTKAKYQLFYGDDATGSAPHKKDQPVKQNDIKNSPFTILKGTKVESYYADAKLVVVGDNLVLQVDKNELSVAVGNLTLGKYYWKEVDAPIGYAIDPNSHPFEITKKDDQTANIVTPNTKSQDQLIKAKINFQKLVEVPGESAESGFNDIDFIFTPIKGTKADPKVVTTGIKDDIDGYGEVLLEYGIWKMTESLETAPDGYDIIKPIYIYMTTDSKTDVITITASWNEDGSKPFSKRQFYQSDNSGNTNSSISGSKGGTVTDSNPFISLSRLTLTDKGVRDPEPSIDVEKSSSEITQSGNGNKTDKPDNIGEGDADTDKTAIIVTDDETKINFKVKNNGEEDLIKVKAVDKTTEGKVDVKDIKWTYQGKELTTDKDGIFQLDGKALIFKVGETIEATGTLKLAPGESHADLVTVTGVGITSGKEVNDEDEWHGKRPKPSIDVEKSSETITKAGDGNNTDKPDNLGAGDADTAETAVVVTKDKTVINFQIKNNGDEDLTDVKAVDKTIDGKADVKNIVWSYNGKTLTMDKDGIFQLDGKALVFKVGETIKASGELTLTAGETHADLITVSGVGVTSGKEVSDKDEWHGKRVELPGTEEPPTSFIDVEKSSSEITQSGVGNNQDKPNNLGEGDADTAETAVALGDKVTVVNFKIKNIGQEVLTHIKAIDKTINGKDVKDIKWTYKDKALTVDKNGEFELDGKPFELPVGETIVGKGILDALAAGESHADEITVTAVGKETGKSVSDKDSWYAKREANGPLPITGEQGITILVALGVFMIGAVVIKFKTPQEAA